MIPTDGQIKAQVSAIRKKASPSAVAFALRCDAPWNGPSRLTIDGLLHRVVYCRSDLELREQLRTARLEKEPLVALCPFESGQLGEDVLARLAKRRVHPPRANEILGSLFQAATVDPRILTNGPLSQGLIEHAPSDGYPPVPGGALDLQTAWKELLGRLLGPVEVLSGINHLIGATLDPAFCGRMDRMPADLRREFFLWAGLNLGSAACWIAHLAAAGRTSEAIPLGLLLEVVFDPAWMANPEMTSARVRLESWFGGHGIDVTSARSWATATRSVVHSRVQGSGTGGMIAPVLARFDALLSEFKIVDAAGRSDLSPFGFEQRIRDFAGRLSSTARAGGAPERDRSRLLAGIESLEKHLLALDQRRRIERCQMAARLSGWLGAGGRLDDGASLDGMVAGYVRVGGFVDWARTIVMEGDPDPALNKAFGVLAARVDESCVAFEASFATRLADWNLHGAPSGASFVPVENALEKLIGPIAAQTPVLLLVMDGMSVAVFRELLEDIVQRGNWLECQPGPLQAPSALLATVPSITEVSRRALFRGGLYPESTPTEQSAFSANDRLFSQAGGSVRPVLFLKGDLQIPGEAGLSSALKNGVANRKCRVVATVLNAVDDHLSGSDQIAPRWDLDFVRPLRELLQLAAEAGRTLILTSDHGHVLEQQTSLKPGMAENGDRYRTGGGVPTDGEIRVTGQRVQQAIGRDEVTAVWSRGIRFAGKKRGYHGGASPLEVVIPFSILIHRNVDRPETWSEVVPSPSRPDWWSLTIRADADTKRSATTVLPSSPVTAGLDLFVHAASKGREEDWISKLLAGEVYAERQKLAVRGAPGLDHVARFLEVLSSRGGTMPCEVIAERLGLPLLRLAGHVSNLARIFNVDGYEVVRLDSASGTVSLNVALLKKQFSVTD